MPRFGAEPLLFKSNATPVTDVLAGRPSPGDLWVDLSVPVLKRMTAINPDVWVAIEETGPGVLTFSKGADILNPTAVNPIIWRAQFASTVTAVKGYRVGGTGATVNARRNGTSTHLAADLSLTSADTWMDGGTVQNTAYVVGDKLEVMIVSVAGAPAQVAVVVEFTSP